MPSTPLGGRMARAQDALLGPRARVLGACANLESDRPYNPAPSPRRRTRKWGRHDAHPPEVGDVKRTYGALLLALMHHGVSRAKAFDVAMHGLPSAHARAMAVCMRDTWPSSGLAEEVNPGEAGNAQGEGGG